MKADILGYEYEIVELSKYNPLMRDECLIGLCDYEKQVIYLDIDLSAQRKKETLIHELTHAFMYEACLNDVKLNQETICNFVSKYAQRIVDIANRYIKGVEDC